MNTTTTRQNANGAPSAASSSPAPAVRENAWCTMPTIAADASAADRSAYRLAASAVGTARAMLDTGPQGAIDDARSEVHALRAELDTHAPSYARIQVAANRLIAAISTSERHAAALAAISRPTASPPRLEAIAARFGVGNLPAATSPAERERVVRRAIDRRIACASDPMVRRAGERLVAIDLTSDEAARLVELVTGSVPRPAPMSPPPARTFASNEDLPPAAYRLAELIGARRYVDRVSAALLAELDDVRRQHAEIEVFLAERRETAPGARGGRHDYDGTPFWQRRVDGIPLSENAVSESTIREQADQWLEERTRDIARRQREAGKARSDALDAIRLRVIAALEHARAHAATPVIAFAVGELVRYLRMESTSPPSPVLSVDECVDLVLGAVPLVDVAGGAV